MRLFDERVDNSFGLLVGNLRQHPITASDVRPEWRCRCASIRRSEPLPSGRGPHDLRLKPGAHGSRSCLRSVPFHGLSRSLFQIGESCVLSADTEPALSSKPRGPGQKGCDRSSRGTREATRLPDMSVSANRRFARATRPAAASLQQACRKRGLRANRHDFGRRARSQVRSSASDAR